MSKKKEELCTWAIPNFPRKTKAKFAAYCRANGVFIRAHLKDLVEKELRENKVNIPELG